MSQLHGGRIVAKALKNEGVSHIFTLCGGHVMPIYDGCLDVGIRVVDTRHEQTASHAADGWARVTAEPGVAVVTAGPGLTDAVTGVASAWRANIPMLIIGGQGPRSLQDMGSLQDMNHVDLMRPITKWAHSVPEARRLAEYVSMAFRIATTGVPGPVYLEMPVDFLFDSYAEDQLIFPTGARTAAGAYPDPAYIDQAMALLSKAEKPVALVGSQLFWSKRRDAYAPFVEQFGMPIYVNGQARGSLPPEHPNFFTKTRKEALRGADVILIFGTPLDFRLGYGRASHLNPQAKLIHVDLDGGEIGRNRHVDIGIPGDTGMVMAALSAAATGMARGGSPAVREWVRGLRTKEVERAESMRAEMESDTSPINPLRLCKEIDGVLDDDTIVIGDGGDFVATAASVLRIAKIGQWLDPGPLGTLGVGPGYAMAAKLARPGSNVIIVYGDGAFGLNGLEYEAFVRQKINVVGVIGNDAAWMQIRRGQVELYGEERSVATKLDFTHYEKVAEAVGAHGEYVEEPGKIRPALERALSCGKPALVNVRLGVSEFRKGAIFDLKGGMGDLSAGVVVIGNEILSGKVVDTNSPFLAGELRALGVTLRRISTIPDELPLIASEVRQHHETYDLVFTSGGVGPTHDDVSIEGIAMALGRKVIVHPDIADKLKSFYGDKINAARLKMAEVPEGAELITDMSLNFPTIKVENIYILPGIPEIFRSKFESLKPRFNADPYCLKIVYTGVGEGTIAEYLNETLRLFPELLLGSYPKINHPEYMVKVTLESKDAGYVGRAFAHLLAVLPAGSVVRTEE